MNPYEDLLAQVRRRQVAHREEWMKDCCRRFLPHTIYFLADRRQCPEVVAHYIAANGFHCLCGAGRESFCREVNGKRIVLARYTPPELVIYPQ